MSPLQPTSAAYNPMIGATAAAYGHPYGSAHPPPPPIHGLPPAHLQSQVQNPHMISVQNGPVILVSNLNKDVSFKKANRISFKIVFFLSLLNIIDKTLSFKSLFISFLFFFLFRTIR
jgi:hypothetical protein